MAYRAKSTADLENPGWLLFYYAFLSCVSFLYIPMRVCLCVGFVAGSTREKGMLANDMISVYGE